MKKAFAFLWLVFSAAPAYAALAVVTEYDTEDAAIDVTDVPTLPFSMPYTAAGNDAVYCGVQTLTFDTADGASGVTLDTQAMALVTGSQITSDGGGYDPTVEWWVLASPTDNGSDNDLDVVVTLNTQTTRPAGAACYHVSGVNTASPYGAVETGVATGGGSLSDSITTTTANSIVLQINGGKTAASGATQDNGQTETMDVDEVGVDTFWEGSAYLAVASAGATTMGISSVGTDDTVQSLVEVKAAVSQIKTVNGVAVAQIKSVNGVAKAQIKTVEGVSNV